jgi:hypothetical protein
MSDSYSNIYVNLLTIESNKIIDLFPITIVVTDPTTNEIIYQENSLIQYFINNYNTIPQYYFTTYYSDITLLTTDNFIINLPNGYYYYYNSINKFYIYPTYTQIPIFFLGSINSLNTITIFVKSILLDCISLKRKSFNLSYSFQNFNFNKNTISLPGSSLKIIIYNAYNSQYSPLSIPDYGNYNNLINVTIDSLLKIYNYDYSYCKIKNIILSINKLNNLLSFDINKIEAINFMIEILDNDNSVYYRYIVNLNYDLIDNNSSYNVVIFFKNFVENTLFNTFNLYVFDYDYNKYFSKLNESDYDLVLPITVDNANLYDILINSNDDLLVPLIPDLNYDQQNFNKIIIINNLFLNQNIDIISEFLKSSAVSIDLLADYLSNYNIKPYNFWKITTNYSNNTNLNINNFLLNTMLMNVNIKYNLNNNILYYNLYAELFNNNNKIDLYHKNYDLTKNNKKQLIIDFILIILNYLNIYIYFYNDITDLNNKTLILNNDEIISPFTKFNKFILPKSDTNFRFSFDQFFNLNLTIDLAISYKIIVFKSDISDEFDETILNFKYNGFIFQIFNIPNINGNIDNENNVFYIAFSNISECNEFMNYITTGILYVVDNEVTSFFNISPSLNFKFNDITGFYEISSDTTNVINFSVINLDLSTGSVYTNNTINIL